MRTPARLAALTLATVVAAGCSAPAPVPAPSTPSGSGSGHGQHGSPEPGTAELIPVLLATAAAQDVASATAQGYASTLNTLGCFQDPEAGGMGVHYVKDALMDAEVDGLRSYLAKGGFVIFDDFRQEHWYNFEQQMKRVLPSQPLVPLAPEHPIFHVFYEIDPRRFVSPYGGLTPTFYGVHEGNDPTKRLQLVANYNNDLGEYWEFSDTGWVPVDLSNEAYKFGVNYIVYGLTH